MTYKIHLYLNCKVFLVRSVPTVSFSCKLLMLKKLFKYSKYILNRLLNIHPNFYLKNLSIKS